jgi:TnpA family transposase
MPLSSVYLDNGKLYTSSDGQKYSVSVDSLNARPSFKYGGNNHVVAPYNFIDSRHLSYHSQVLSATEREAHYVIDGLLKNDVIKTDMHVTDTHGYTEVVCAVAELLGFNFAPRIKNVLKLQLYSTRAKRSYSSKNYSVLPAKKINMELIRPYWSEILRLVASIKLGTSTASQIFKRLNSYSTCNHPLYNALREYGRMVKTLHILRYIDDPELRVATTKQLNKGESANALDRALAIGKAEIMYATREEQEVMETCKRLIKNCIVCWNYMYLTQRLLKITCKEKRLAFIEKIKVSSTMSWEHIIIHGAFDYSESKLKDSKNFDFNKMQDPKIYEELK